MTRQETWRKVEGAEKDWRSKRIAPVMILRERRKRFQKKKIMTGAIRSQIFFFFFFFALVIFLFLLPLNCDLASHVIENLQKEGTVGGD